jgi:hypothetical protein
MTVGIIGVVIMTPPRLVRIQHDCQVRYQQDATADVHSSWPVATSAAVNQALSREFRTGGQQDGEMQQADLQSAADHGQKIFLL